MDRIGLQTLHEELLNDLRVALTAFKKAGARFARQEEVAYEGCAHQLCQMYNSIEQMCLRIAKAFENHIDDEQGWHTGLLNRLSLAITGVRPALIPQALKPSLQELKNFRHVFVHAYDLELDPEKLALLLKYAERVADQLPQQLESFVAEVARQEGFEPAPK